MIYCNPGPGKHLCSYAMIKSKLNLVPPGESPKGIPKGYPNSSKVGLSNSRAEKKLKYTPFFKVLL